jgi:hypothetical protein
MGNRKNFDDNSNILSDVSYVSEVEATESIGTTVPSGGGSTVTVDEDWAKTEPMDGGKTEIAGMFEHQGKKVSPTVGWLICISGPCKGEDFRLHTGWNYIGRGHENEINIPDPKVDRSNMAKIAYDHRGRSFVIAPGDNTRNLTYWDGKPLLMPTAIKAYDVITVGDSELMFVPLCGEHFSWEE